MIEYLQKLKAKKGFTMMELIVVIAIIGVLIAMVIPAFNNDDAKRRAADTYASDFYASLQYCLTRYQKTDYHITPDLAKALEDYTNDPVGKPKPYIQYDKNLGQNVLTMPTGETEYNLYVEVCYDRGIRYVKFADSFEALLTDISTTSDLAAEKQLQADLEGIINEADEGYYYAVVNFDSTYNNFKVLSAHYIDTELPDYNSSLSSDFRDGLMFTDWSELKNGIICCTCSTDQNATGNYVGNPGSYFLNLTSDLTANEVVDYI